ncbi:spore gernimation protein GerPD [Bacillus sp. RAR_GA_16]|uniref:spore gernimation protein GerPD n=1 Tax=Bacillus sp. RAR_GA_16 TaxID=2876774 RepID=UPI001CCB2125|nr:spore gernimation protein GerPD [Bacillus sp. RAR_GA_16]MCA0172406.1 spore gernimation protein GerPD [Bacillus sp. RAR_GA_16]
MNYTVINRGLSVGHIEVTAVASSSVLLVGDTESIVCSSIFDTPPESLIISRPFVPLSTS